MLLLEQDADGHGDATEFRLPDVADALWQRAADDQALLELGLHRPGAVAGRMGAVAKAGIDEEGQEPPVRTRGGAHRCFSPLRSAGSRPPWHRASTPGRPSCRRAGERCRWAPLGGRLAKRPPHPQVLVRSLVAFRPASHGYGLN